MTETTSYWTESWDSGGASWKWSWKHITCVRIAVFVFRLKSFICKCCCERALFEMRHIHYYVYFNTFYDAYSNDYTIRKDPIPSIMNSPPSTKADVIFSIWPLHNECIIRILLFYSPIHWLNSLFSIKILQSFVQQLFEWSSHEQNVFIRHMYEVWKHTPPLYSKATKCYTCICEIQICQYIRPVEIEW